MTRPLPKDMSEFFLFVGSQKEEKDHCTEQPFSRGFSYFHVKINDLRRRYCEWKPPLVWWNQTLPSSHLKPSHSWLFHSLSCEHHRVEGLTYGSLIPRDYLNLYRNPFDPSLFLPVSNLTLLSRESDVVPFIPLFQKRSTHRDSFTSVCPRCRLKSSGPVGHDPLPGNETCLPSDKLPSGPTVSIPLRSPLPNSLWSRQPQNLGEPSLTNSLETNLTYTDFKNLLGLLLFSLGDPPTFTWRTISV